MSELYNISNAFKELDLLTEDTFKADDAGIDKLRDFMDGDQVDEITIIDPEAETFDDVKESYIGKIILNCGVCQSKFYKDKEDIVIDEETQLANAGEECPYCTSADGFEIVGQVAEYCPDCDEDEDYDDDASEDQLDLDESVSNTPWDKIEKTYGDQLKSGNVKSSVKPKADSTPDNPNSPWSKIARAYGKQLDLDESWADNKEMSTLLRAMTADDSNLNRYLDRAFKVAKRYEGSKPYQGNYTNIIYTDSGNSQSSADKTIRQWASSNNVNLVELNGENVTSTKLNNTRSHELFNALNKPNSVLFIHNVDNIPREAVNELSELVSHHLLADSNQKKGEIFLPNMLFMVATASDTSSSDTLKESRDLTKFDGTIAKLLSDNMSKLSNITDVNELKSKIVDLLDSSAIKDKKAVADFKARMDKIKNISSLISTIATYITGMKSQPKDSKKAVKESVESVEVKTDTDKICVDTEGDSTKVEVKPRDDFEAEAEMITPVDDEVKDEIEAEQVSDEEVSDEEVEDEDNFEDVDFDEFDEESFDELGEQYLKKVYENVKSYKTSSGSMKNDKLKLEGVITFNSGKQAKTTFLFEGASILKNGTLKLIGENKNFSDKKNAFGLRGRVSGNKLMVESFNYNYIGKDAATGQSKKLYGTIRKTK